MLSSAGCWAAYGEVLAREYTDPALFAASHRLTVDAYALQHPGETGDRRAVQSVWLHFASLDAIFARGLSHDAARGVLQKLAGKPFPALPPAPLMTITLADVVMASEGRHLMVATQWARSAYLAWQPLLSTNLTW